MDLHRPVILAAALLVALMSCGGEAPSDADRGGADAPGTGPTPEAPQAGPTPAAPEPSSRPGEPGTDTTGAALPSRPSTWAYICSDGLRFTVHYREEEARVELPARELVLPHDPSAPEAQYASDDGLLRAGAGEADLEVGSERYVKCSGRRATTPEDAARLLGFDFRGLGQEPGWLVDIDADRQIRWVGDYGSVRFATGPPETEERDDGTVVWTAAAGPHRIRVYATPEPCRDAMSGRPFSHTVEVTADDRTYEGCGLWLEEERS